MGIHSTDAIFNTFSAFAKFCIDKKEVPYFEYNSTKIDKFFYDIKQEYPKEFEGVRFNTDGPQPLSHTINENKVNMLTEGYLFSLSPKFNPHFVSKNLLKYFEKIKNKEIYLDVAKNLYNEFGCDLNGNFEKRTKFKSLENLH